MQVFNAFIKVMRSKMSSGLIYIVIFLVIAVIMTNSAQTDGTKVFEGRKIGVVVYDDDNTEESRALKAYIGKKQNLKELERDADLIKDTIYMNWNNEIHYIMAIKKGYAEHLRSGEYNDLFENYYMHDSYENVMMEQLLTEYLNTVSAYQAGGRPLSEAISETESVLSAETEVTIRNFDETAADHDMSPLFDDYFRYLPYILLSVLIEVLCPVLLTMNKKNIRYRTDCSSVRPTSYMLQIILGSALFVVAIWLIFMIAGVAEFGMFRGRAWLTLLNSFLFAMIAVSLSVLIASFHPSDLVVNLLAQILGLGMSFLCGIFVPMEWLSDSIAAAAKFLPAYWYIQANDLICGKQAYDGQRVLVCLLIEAGFAVVFALASMVIRRYEAGKTSAA